MQGEVPHPTHHTTPGAGPLYGDVGRYLSPVLPKAPEVPLLPWGVPSGSPARGRGKLGATDPAPAPLPRLISLPEMCIWLDSPWGPPLATQGQRII